MFCGRWDRLSRNHHDKPLLTVMRVAGDVVHIPALIVNGKSDDKSCNFSWGTGGLGNTRFLLPPKCVRSSGVEAQVHSVLNDQANVSTHHH